jgi:hypothetical protein
MGLEREKARGLLSGVEEWKREREREKKRKRSQEDACLPVGA